MAKSKVEKETRRLMEAVSDLVKRKGDRFKFKSKNKKLVKKVKRDCIHWIYRKGKECPTVTHDPENPGNWKCMICGASFPIVPLQQDEYKARIEDIVALVNQLAFYSVKLGGNADDTKMFIQLRRNLNSCAKASKPIIKHINKRDRMERNRQNTDSSNTFSAYSGYNYRG